MKRYCYKVLCMLLCALLATTSLPLLAYAADTDASFVTKGTYSFTTNENSNIQAIDSFTFREDCFMRSSHLGCCHLYELSASAALASTSRYGDEPDPYEIDPSNNGQNIKKMLEDMGFSDVATNQYYTLEKLEDSAAVCVGHRQIEAFGKTYTLLAIIPRSAGYKREWVGNLTVEGGDIHQGFKAGRDEILRFVKQYMDENGISGSLKVWTAGHSRGSALANLVAGFFAGGGIGYFGSDVSIAPEDVYCYAFANPTVIKNGAAKNEELSVEGARGGVYENDTPGEAYAYTGGGVVDPRSEVYNGIRNYPLPYDVITMLPPELWGFTLYGHILTADADGAVSVDDMLAELKDICPYAYDRFVNGGDFRSFEWETFDLDALALAKDESMPEGSMAQFLKERIAGLTYHASTNQEYATGGGQSSLKAAAGLYGMLLPLLSAHTAQNPDSSIVDSLNPSELIRPAAMIYLAYASERLMAEGRATDEGDAVTLAIEDLLSYASGEDIGHDSMNVDDAACKLLKFVFFEEVDGQLVEKDTELSRKAVQTILGLIPDKYDEMLYSAFSGFDKNKGTSIPVTLETVITAFLKACVAGADPECEMAGVSAEAARQVLFGMAMLATMSSAPAISNALSENGTKPFSQLVAAVASLLELVKDDSGDVVYEYSDLQEAADDAFVDIANSLLGKAVDQTKEIYGDAYYEAANGYLEALKENKTIARRLVSYLLLYSESYSTESAIRNAASCIKNFAIIPPAHYNETSLAWARAVRVHDADACDHYILHEQGTAATCTAEGVKEHWLYHEKGSDRFFLQRNLATETSEKDMVLEPLGHEWGEWVVTKKPTETQEGLQTRTCKRDSSHVETKAIPAAGPVAASYTITYQLNGGTLDGKTGTVTQRYSEGTVITLPEPTRQGYSFDGWEDGSYKAGDSYTVAEDRIFTARWKENAGGSSGSPSDSGTKGTTPTSSAPATSRTAPTGDTALPAGLVALALAAGAGALLARSRQNG